MRKKTVTLFVSTAIIILTLSSYDDGPWGAGGSNGQQRTGAASTAANCSGSTCHGNNSSSTLVTVSILNGTTPVTSYIAGHIYNIKVVGSVVSGTYPRFGFQLAAVKSSATSTQAGSFTAGSGLAVRTGGSLGSLQIIEHTAPIAGTAAGSGWLYTSQFSWTAPAAGTGSVKFFLTLNAVNFDGHSTGDQANSGNTVITESTSGINDVVQKIDVVTYPNPVTNQLHIDINGAENESFTVRTIDAAGKMIYTGALQSSAGKAQQTVNTQSWAAGIYHVIVTDGNARKIVSVVKQ